MIYTNKQKLLLFFLLVIIIILFTTYYYYPWHPDHYTLGQYTYALIENGRAPWILHPISLFGYYPLSIPSGFEYFFAVLYNISLLDLPILFYIFSIFSALFAVTGVYLVMREYSSFETSFITAFILSTTVYFVKNLSNTASSRMFNIIFYPLFILTFFKIIKIYEKKHKISIKYVIVSFLLFITMNLIHRLGQLSIIFIISFFAAIIFDNFDNILKLIKNTKIYSLRKNFYKYSILLAYIDLEIILLIIFSYFFIKINLVWINFVFLILIHYFWFDYYAVLHKHRSKNFLIIDIISFIIYFIIAKIVDLMLRGRFLVNLFNIIDKYLFQLILLSIILISSLILGIFIILRKYKNLKIFLNLLKNKSIEIVRKDYKILISLVLFLIMLFFISRNFTGDNFYKYGFEHYTESFLLKGTSPWVIMLNFIFNLNNNVTILIYFAIVGVLYLFLKVNKTFYEYFFIFVALGFSQFLLDWEYIRLYILPIYAIFIGIGLTFTIQWLSNKFNKKVIFTSLVILFIGHLIIANIFIQRETILPNLGFVKYESTIPEEYYISLGQYLLGKGEISIHTSSSKTAHDSKVAYYAKKINSVVAQSVFTENKNHDIEGLPFIDIFNSFKRGEKITEVFKLKDQIFGSYYYFGRHIFNLDKKSINNREVNEVINLYRIKYVVDSSESEQKTEFFASIELLKNKVYSSEKLYLYDLNRGR